MGEDSRVGHGGGFRGGQGMGEGLGVGCALFS